jgi:hypothetical protein
VSSALDVEEMTLVAVTPGCSIKFQPSGTILPG